MAMMAGCIGAAYYKDVDDEMVKEVQNALPDEMLTVIEKFEDRYL